MPDPKIPCVSTGERSDVSSWEYVGGVPVDVTTSASGGVGPGVCSQVTYLWKRTFSLRYRCSCGGKATDEVIVPGNVEYYTVTVHASFTTISLSFGLPLPGVLGAIADVLGASIDVAHFWAPGEEAAVDARAQQEAPNASTPANCAKSKLMPVPVAICGNMVDFGGGNIVPWPKSGAPVKPADDRTELGCISTNKFTKVSIGWGTGNDNDEAKKDAEKHLKLVTPTDIQRLIEGYRCKAPCGMKMPPKIEYGQMKFTPPENPADKKPNEAYWCFASWEWTITLECVLS